VSVLRRCWSEWSLYSILQMWMVSVVQMCGSALMLLLLPPRQLMLSMGGDGTPLRGMWMAEHGAC
jgi:hypothetical protein